jgi:hypothetical protein
MGVCNTTSPVKLVVHKTDKPLLRINPQLVEYAAGCTSSTAPQQKFSTARDGTVSPSRPATAATDNPTTTTANRKKVHFHASDSNCPAGPLTRIIHTIPSIRHMDEHDRAQLWWTKEERRDISERNQTTVRDYLHRHAQHVGYLQQVFREDCCCSYESVAVVTSDDDTASSASLLSTSSEDSSDEDEEELFSSRSRKRGRRPTSRLHELCHKRRRQRHEGSRSIRCSNKINLPTSVRGLEYGILPEAKSHRKLHRIRILDWQHRIKTQQHSAPPTDTSSGMDNTDRMATVLQQQSLLSSLRSRKLAQLLAASDASAEEESDGFVSGTSNNVVIAETTMHSTTGGYRYSMGAASRQARPRMMPSSMW